eukprot:scaffold7591_cov132-Isochrysis_galbana.AAC.1
MSNSKRAQWVERPSSMFSARTVTPGQRSSASPPAPTGSRQRGSSSATGTALRTLPLGRTASASCASVQCRQCQCRYAQRASHRTRHGPRHCRRDHDYSTKVDKGLSLQERRAAQACKFKQALSKRTSRALNKSQKYKYMSGGRSEAAVALHSALHCGTASAQEMQYAHTSRAAHGAL